MKQNLEMVICPICGKPFPKKRKELGYNYCVECSTEKQKVCVVESYGEGDHNYNDIVILSQEEAWEALKPQELDPVYIDVDENGEGIVEEETLFEDEAIELGNSQDRDSYLDSLENEFVKTFDPVVLEQMEQIGDEE